MSKCLILLSFLYPYEKSEPFLESEIKYLEEFDRVYIIPCSQKKNHQQTRLLPSESYKIINMSTDNRGILTKLKWFFWALYSFLCGPFWIEIWKLFKSRKLNLKRTISLIKFITYAERNYHKAKKELKKENIHEFEEIIVYSYWFHNFAYIGVRLKKWLSISKKVEMISRAHSYDFYEYTNRINYIPLRDWLFRNIKKVFPVSNDGVTYLKNRHPYYSSKIQLQRLGTIDNGFKVIKRNSMFHIVTCSNIVPVKRIELLIEALSTISDIQIKWTHFGSGELHKEIEQMAEEKLKDEVHFNFQGHVPNKEVLKYYKESKVDLFINISEREGVPVSIMEAISFGIPVIATKVGGNPEVVKDQVNGFILEKDFNVSKLKDLIIKFAKMSDNDYLEYRRNARYIWEENFNADVNYQKFTQDIQNLL